MSHINMGLFYIIQDAPMITSKINKTRIRAHDALVPWVLSQVIFSLLFIILYSDFYNVSKEKPN